ncbi:hypothetical protein SSP35_27_00120 [Streptomyces sp. NBRC 110611]|nr:hypothetical protein SSP35_27_00120 [Streptomyces sp. NBRC 110611]
MAGLAADFFQLAVARQRISLAPARQVIEQHWDGSVGLDATPVRTFSRGVAAAEARTATDPDAAWYVCEGDHATPPPPRPRRKEGQEGQALPLVTREELSELCTVADVPSRLAGRLGNAGELDAQFSVGAGVEGAPGVAECIPNPVRLRCAEMPPIHEEADPPASCPP